MFFDQLSQITQLATQHECLILVAPEQPSLPLPHPLILQPDITKKTLVITVEQIRDFIALAQQKETTDRFFVIQPADAMNEPSQNAFLKTLEEPKPHCHFVLITEHPTALLATIRSRAPLFFYRQSSQFDRPPAAQPEIVALAKKLIAARPADLPELATQLSKNKTNARDQALAVVETAIDLLYKTYFKTSQIKFLQKLENLLQLHQHLSQNGHLKLQIVADLC